MYNTTSPIIIVFPFFPSLPIVKFIDDGTVVVSVDLKSSLISSAHDGPRPHNYHERTGHVLPDENNLLHYYIRDTEKFAQENGMIINKQKNNSSQLYKIKKVGFS